MRDSLKTLLGIAFTIGLSDREKFVQQVSGVIDQYQDDPAKAERWTKAVTDYIDQMRENMNLENAIQSAIRNESLPDQATIEELTKAIKELTAEMQKTKNQ